MQTIWKFPLEITDVQAVEIPTNFDILTVQMQDGKLALWARVDPNTPTFPLQVFIYGTGRPCSNWGHYIGTVQDAPFVWHVFSARKSQP